MKIDTNKVIKAYVKFLKWADRFPEKHWVKVDFARPHGLKHFENQLLESSVRGLIDSTATEEEIYEFAKNSIIDNIIVQQLMGW